MASFSFFFFNDTATTEIYTLSLHDALPISLPAHSCVPALVSLTTVEDGAGPMRGAPLVRSCDEVTQRRERSGCEGGETDVGTGCAVSVPVCRAWQVLRSNVGGTECADRDLLDAAVHPVGGHCPRVAEGVREVVQGEWQALADVDSHAGLVHV